MDDTVPDAKVRAWFARPHAQAPSPASPASPPPSTAREATTPPMRWSAAPGSRASSPPLTERSFYKVYHSRLSQADHWTRLDRLLWEGRESQAHRMLLLVDPGHRALPRRASICGAPTPAWTGRSAASRRGCSKTRASFTSASAGAAARGATRRRWRFSATCRRCWAGPACGGTSARRWCAAASPTAPSPTPTAWPATMARSPARGWPRREFLAGWVALRFLHDDKVALGHFARMYDGVRTPISRSRAAYWAGRAADAAHQPKAALEWYRRAAAHDWCFYGQLAALRAGVTPVAPTAPAPAPSAATRPRSTATSWRGRRRPWHAVGHDELMRAFVLRLGQIAQTDDRPHPRRAARRLAGTARPGRRDGARPPITTASACLPSPSR